jgi:hypothetical protein
MFQEYKTVPDTDNLHNDPSQFTTVLIELGFKLRIEFFMSWFIVIG